MLMKGEIRCGYAAGTKRALSCNDASVVIFFSIIVNYCSWGYESTAEIWMLFANWKRDCSGENTLFFNTPR